MTPLTPPADAPLPFSVHVDPQYGPTIVDAKGAILAGVSIEGDGTEAGALVVARYLVAAANALPDLRERFLAATSDAVWAAHQRDTALARVAELEQEVARLTAIVAESSNSGDDFHDNPCHVCASPPGVRCPHDDQEIP